jgi:hypothetical protein
MNVCFRGGRVCGHGAFQAGNAPYGAKRITAFELETYRYHTDRLIGQGVSRRALTFDPLGSKLRDNILTAPHFVSR